MRKQLHPIFGRKPSGSDQRECFVLMPFRRKWSASTWKVIGSTLTNYGIVFRRADEMYGQIVIEDIWKAINTARLIIADVTGKNANVFYELGIAHTLGKEVLLLAQSTKDIPFDLNRFRHILYEPIKSGYGRLRTQIFKALWERKIIRVPLPRGLEIQRPAIGIKSRIATFLGIWEGRWKGKKEGSLPHILAVQRINFPKANVIYAWGDSVKWNIRAGYRSRDGVLRGTVLWLRWPGVKIRYKFGKSSDTLYALRIDADGTFRAVLRRVSIGLRAGEKV